MNWISDVEGDLVNLSNVVRIFKDELESSYDKPFLIKALTSTHCFVLREYRTQKTRDTIFGKVCDMLIPTKTDSSTQE